MTDDVADGPPPGFEVGDGIDDRLAWFARNDTGNAKRLMERHGRDLLYVHEIGWHAWIGTHWCEKAGPDTVQISAQETAKAISGEAAALAEAGPVQGEKEEEFQDRLLSHVKFGTGSGNNNRLRGMVQEAKPHVSVRPHEMDADPRLLNLGNGTLLMKGACQDIRPHAREDRIARVMAVEYDADATCPQWETFVARILPDEAVRGFLQRWFGYCLTGMTREQVIVFLFGEGANGKSTMLEVLARIMGPYANTLPFSSLQHDEHKRGGDATPDLARLVGSRLVRASEPEKGARFSESTIKSMTGGEPIPVRNLRQGFFDLMPEFKLVISGNHMPRIMGNDHGLWRRLLLVPFTVVIPKNEIDDELVDKLLAERAGVLNWLLDGLRLYFEDGLAVPDVVRMATDDYREESDPIGRFLAACVEASPGDSVQARDMFRAYTLWCKANAERVFSETAFGRALPEHGLKKGKYAGFMYYDDVRVVNVPEPDVPDPEGPPPDG